MAVLPQELMMRWNGANQVDSHLFIFLCFLQFVCLVYCYSVSAGSSLYLIRKYMSATFRIFTQPNATVSELLYDSMTEHTHIPKRCFFCFICVLFCLIFYDQVSTYLERDQPFFRQESWLLENLITSKRKAFLKRIFYKT